MNKSQIGDEHLNELLLKAKNHDDTAFEQLYECFHPVVYTLRKKYFLKDFELDDWLQLGRIVFYRLVNTYKSDCGVTLGKYFKVIFQREVLDHLRRASAQKRKINSETVSLEEITESVECHESFQLSSVEADFEVRDTFKNYLQLLTSFELTVISLYADGFSVRAIATKLDCSQQIIYRTLQKSKKILKDLFFD